MDQITARKLVKDTLQNPFDRVKFQYLLKNLLNHFEDSAFIYRGGTIPEAYRDYVVTFERIGKYQDLDDNKIDILAVYLKKNFSLENARTMQRNLVAWYLNGSRGDILKDAALVAFIAPNGEDWRFSLVKMEYKITETPSGKVKAKEELTPARRHSFLVGIHEDSHTAQSQLVPILCDDTNDPSLEQLEGAFNIEKVTKEFFEKYHSLFLNLKENLDLIVEKDPIIKKDFESKNVNTIDFAKKLLGQIVFLYFLQKKGWFGVARDESWGTGPRDFLRKLFDKKIVSYDNFFNDILEPLFYNTLAVERTDDYSDRFNCKIPFLNGGLFDPISAYDWVHTDICLPNNLFSNDEPTKEGDKGTGILDVFDRYNFTVKEDEPLEKEVAVDPEMLGKVFENLLEVKDRKSKGTYYTPREIVHYMCQESLINYLVTECEGKVSKEDIETLIKFGETAVEHDALYVEKKSKGTDYEGRYDTAKLTESIRKNSQLIDEKLKNIRVCDPAIGSGAFPVGMMNEIVRTRNALSNYIQGQLGRSIYNFKRHAIQSCLYGVDIDAGAVEIAKLRLWLSLVVDEEDIHAIKPLPNLDYKIMQGNSLIELFSPNLTGYGTDPERNKLIDELNSCRREFFNATSQSEKTRLRLAVNEQIRNIVNYDKNQKISRIKNKLEGFRGQEKLFTLEGENLSLVDASETKEETTLSKELKELEKVEQMSPDKHFEWHLNFNEVFNEKGGFDVVIGNPPYIDSEGMVKSGLGDLREVIQKSYKWTRGNWDIYIAFFELGFKELNQNGTLTFITPDKWISKPFGDEFRKGIIDNIFILLRAGRKVFENAKVDSIISFFAKQKYERLEVVDFVNDKFVSIREIDKNSLLSPFALDHLFSSRLDLLLKIEVSKYKLFDFSKTENACATSDAYKLKSLIFGLKIGLFDQTQQLKIINTGTISKYHSRWGEREMTYLGHKYLFPVVDRKKFLATFKNSYANKSVQPKIVIKGLNLLDGCLDHEGFIIPGKTTLVIVDSDIEKLKILLAIVNSRLSIFYIKEKYSASSYNQGIGFTKDMLNNLPIPELSDSAKKEVIHLVDKILVITEASNYLENPTKNEEVKEYEKQIDQMVYKLYELTPEEIEIVEKSI